MTKKILIGLSSMLLIMSLVFVGSTLGNSKVSVADTTDMDQENTVTVNGMGEIKVAPDMATVNIGLKTEDPDADAAQTANADLMSKIVAALKGEGIAETDIKTAQYNLYKTSDYVEGKERKEYYVASNTVNVIVRDIDKVGEIIDVASANGANSINNIAFSISDDSAYYQEALKLAMTNAKGKANAIMGTFGETATVPVTVVEASNGGSIVYNESMVRDFATNSSTPIESGELTISANVTVTYNY